MVVSKVLTQETGTEKGKDLMVEGGLEKIRNVYQPDTLDSGKKSIEIHAPATVRAICEYLKNGATIVDACKVLRIGRGTFYKLAKNPKIKELFVSAEYECKMRNIALIQKAALRTWQAAGWWLERKHKDEFAVRAEFAGANGKNVTINVVSEFTKKQKK